jgi:hypothetical protein
MGFRFVSHRLRWGLCRASNNFQNTANSESGAFWAALIVASKVIEPDSPSGSQTPVAETLTNSESRQVRLP